jgi:hypothetical protein
MRWIVRRWKRRMSKQWQRELSSREIYDEWEIGSVEAPDRDTALERARKMFNVGKGGRIAVTSAIDDALAREDAAIVESNQRRALRRGELSFGGLRSNCTRIALLRDRLRKSDSGDGEQDAAPGEPAPVAPDYGAAPEGAPAGEGPGMAKAVA